MPSLEKALRRDRKRKKKKDGMKITGRSVFTIQRELEKRATKIRNKRRKEKNELAESL